MSLIKENSLLEDAEACARRSQDILDKIVDSAAALESGYSSFQHGHDLPPLGPASDLDVVIQGTFRSQVPNPTFLPYAQSCVISMPITGRKSSS